MGSVCTDSLDRKLGAPGQEQAAEIVWRAAGADDRLGCAAAVRVYPVTRPGLLMAQATLPGLQGMLRPVFAPPVTVVRTRLTRTVRAHRLG